MKVRIVNEKERIMLDAMKMKVKYIIRRVGSVQARRVVVHSVHVITQFLT